MTQNIQLTGIVDDNTLLAPTMPRNTATTFLLPQFASVNVYVHVHNNAGVAVDVSNLTEAVLTMQRQLDPCQRIPELRVTGVWAGAPNAKNLLRFPISPADTRQLNLGRYFFDVWLTLPSGTWVGRWQILRVGTAVLQAALQRA